jgi:hypothetical protein
MKLAAGDWWRLARRQEKSGSMSCKRRVGRCLARVDSTHTPLGRHRTICLHRHMNRPCTLISMEMVVDMQIVAAYYATQGTRLTKCTMPGLKSTCTRYLASAGNCNVVYALGKTERNTDWSQRPLRLSQFTQVSIPEFFWYWGIQCLPTWCHC